MENDKNSEVAYLLELRSQIEDRIRELSADALIEFELQKLAKDDTLCEECGVNKKAEGFKYCLECFGKKQENLKKLKGKPNLSEPQSDPIIIEHRGYLLVEGTKNLCEGCCFDYACDKSTECRFPDSYVSECDSSLIYKLACNICGKACESNVNYCTDCQYERKMSGY